MFSIWVLCLCSIMTLYLLLDFFMKNYTTYGIAKAIPGPYMWPIIGATKFFLSPQGEWNLYSNLAKKIIQTELLCNCFTDKTFEISTKFCKKFKNGFAYWSFGFFIYQMYSADSFEV